jgi:hypothetical protein
MYDFLLPSGAVLCEGEDAELEQELAALLGWWGASEDVVEVADMMARTLLQGTLH